MLAHVGKKKKTQNGTSIITNKVHNLSVTAAFPLLFSTDTKPKLYTQIIFNLSHLFRFLLYVIYFYIYSLKLYLYFIFLYNFLSNHSFTYNISRVSRCQHLALPPDFYYSYLVCSPNFGNITFP